MVDFVNDGFVAPPTVIGADSETELIQAGLLAPPLVCVSTARRVPGGFSVDLHDHRDGLSFYRRALSDPFTTLVIHNGPFDLGVACNEDPELLVLVFDAFEAGRICCTITLQKLIDVALDMRKFRRYRNKVAKAVYGLDDLILMYYEEIVEKEETWRLSFGLLRGVPVHRWPPRAREYAIKDSVLHLRLWEGQQSLIRREFGGFLPNQVEQQRANWALHLMSMWGLRAEAAASEKFVEHCTTEIEKMKVDLAGTGILKARYKCRGKCEHEAEEWWSQCPRCGKAACVPNPKAGSRTMKEIQRRVVHALMRKQVQIPMTPPSPKFPQGQVKTDEETLRLTEDEKLIVLADSLTFQKHLGQWGPVLRAAVLRPVCCKYNVLVDNGRTSASGSEGQEGTNCFDGETEVLTPAGWVRFDALAEEALIAQWADGVVSFVERTATIRNGPSPLVLLENEQVNLAVTPDHRCLIRTKKGGRLKVYRADEYPAQQIQLHAGKYFATKTIEVSAAFLTLLCAVQADGYYHDNGIDFTFRKKRKIGRLLGALDALNAEYSQYKDKQGQTRIRILASPLVERVIFMMPEKMFGSWVLQLDRERLDQFCEEVFLWDGFAKKLTHYRSNHKVNADWVQTAIVLSGRRANIRIYQGKKNLSYQVDVSKKGYSYTSNIERAEGWAEATYCVSVPSSYLLVRRRGKVVVTGNCQNPPRKGDVRPCFVPRRGWVFVSTDADTIELRALAQNCLDMVGWSRMAEVIKRQYHEGGPDLHVVLAAGVAGITESAALALHSADDVEFANVRQMSKHGNFAFAGGAGAETFVKMARGFGIRLGPTPERELSRAKELRKIWFYTWPEMREYFKIIERLVSADGVLFHCGRPLRAGTIIQMMSGRIRGGCRYTSCANCVDYETEALTKRGWLRGTEVTLEDELLTKNIETQELEWQKPQAINHFPDYRGPLVEFETSTMSAVTTPDHRWMVDDREGNTKCVTTKEMSRWGEHLIHRTGELVVGDAPYDDDFVELIGWVLTDGNLHRSKACKTTRVTIFQSKVNNIERIDRLFQRLNIGAKRLVRKGRGLPQVQWHFTDNPQRRKEDIDPCFRSTRRNGKPTTRRGFTVQDYLRAGAGNIADELVAQKLGVTIVAVREVRKRHGIEKPPIQRIDSKGYAGKIRGMFPDRLLTSEFVSQLSRRQANLLAEVMFLGDGTKTDTQEKFFTRSERAADAFQQLLMLAGFSSRSEYRDMSKYSPKSEKLANIPKMTGIWIVMKYTRSRSQIATHQVNEIAEASQGVWCPSVPNTYFVARRKKSTYITGNSFFSGRVADAEKEILWRLADECYTGRCTTAHRHGGSSHCTLQGRVILYGSRPALFLHDEPILEHPEDGTESDRAERQKIVVVETLNKWMPGVPCTSSAVMMRRWQKGAKPLFVDGKLVPVRPEKFVGADGKAKVKWVHDILDAPTIISPEQFELDSKNVDVEDYTVAGERVEAVA